MSRIVVLLLALSSVALAADDMKCVAFDGSAAHSVQVLGFCNNDRWIAYRIGNDLLVVCGVATSPIPSNAIELREYYVVKPRGHP